MDSQSHSEKVEVRGGASPGESWGSIPGGGSFPGSPHLSC